ncbi:MAG: hypothetical protein Q7U54_18860 [Bacteroidales bacterium]|nr:hypothetical protein [Bacteroidales bacterium]
MNRKNKIPFCPVCGKVDYVSILDKYFEIWKCIKCKIKFDFSSYPFDDLMPDPARTYPTRKYPLIINPAKIAVINPSRRVLIEQNTGKIKLTGDIDSFNELLVSKDLLSLLPNSLGDKNCTQSGEIDLDNVSFNSVKY